MSIAVVGIYTRDLYMIGRRLPRPGETVNCDEFHESDGGKGANQAVAAARLGGDVRLITCLGKDAQGDEAFRLLEREGVQTDSISLIDDYRTGVSFVTVDQRGAQLVANFGGVPSRYLSECVISAADTIRGAQVLLLQGEIEAGVSLRAAQIAGADTLILLDPSPVETFQNCDAYTRIDIVTPNQQEAMLLTGSATPSAREVSHATGVDAVVLTRGGEDVELYADGKTVRIPVPYIEAVDTTGAGDAFNGAMSVRLACGESLVDAATFAVQVAATSVQRRFCIPSYPLLRDLGAL